MAWVVLGLCIVVVTLGIVAGVMIRRAVPILKARVTESLSTRFNGRVELDRLDVSLIRGLEVSGGGLRIFPPDDVMAAGATQPLIAIQNFAFHAGVLGLFREPMQVRLVRVTGLQIHIPPRSARRAAVREKSHKPHGKIKILVYQIVCEHSQLVIDTDKPEEQPKEFQLEHITLQDVGPSDPWHYDATLTNAIPRGEIHSTGTFGPWQTESPGDSPVTGHYTFDHADLNTIKGLAGILSSTGDFTGQLDRIVVDGTTETPDFSLDTANHPVPLHTRFHAIVDGLNGDTRLEPVSATLGNSSFTTSGAVVNIKGRGHTIDLDVDVPAGQVQDFLQLAVKTDPPVLTGVIGTKAKLHIRPGPEHVMQKLSLKGAFTLRGMHFTNAAVQDKVDGLSLRAQGEPEKARPGAPDVFSNLKGQFSLQDGVIQFSELSYTLPGARVNLEGTYSLDGQVFDFHGKVLTDVSLSKMVDSKVLSVLLKAASPFFKKAGGGAEIPVQINGTKSEPKFGLDVLKHDSK